MPSSFFLLPRLFLFLLSADSLKNCVFIWLLMVLVASLTNNKLWKIETTYTIKQSSGVNCLVQADAAVFDKAVQWVPVYWSRINYPAYLWTAFWEGIQWAPGDKQRLPSVSESNCIYSNKLANWIRCSWLSCDAIHKRCDSLLRTVTFGSSSVANLAAGKRFKKLPL